ncbi:Os03g0433733, partial [Oryza sativa Japonica Group]
IEIPPPSGLRQEPPLRRELPPSSASSAPARLPLHRRRPDPAYITQATTLYKSEEKKTFSLMYCWEILHHHPKWNDRLSQKKQKANVDPLVIPSARTNSREFHCSPDISISDPLVRPPGRKVEKAKRARGDTSSCSSESSLVVIALTNMWSEKKEMSAQSREERNDRLGEVISLEKERLKIEK